jgi:hypothetical protein
MRTGFFAFLSSKKAVNKDSAPSFGKEVLEAVKNSKGTTEEEIAGEMKGVLDSMSELKDCDAKDTLMNVVKDCFDNKDKVLANEAEVVSTLDSMWVDIHSDSLGEIAKAFAKLGSKPSTSATGTEDNAPAVNKDSDEPKDGEDKDSADKENKDEPKKGEDKDSEGGDKKDDKSKDGCNKDSANELFVTKDDILALKKEIGSLVTETVKECLGIKEKKEPTGSALDSATKSAGAPERDYSSFLD